MPNHPRQAQTHFDDVTSRPRRRSLLCPLSGARMTEAVIAPDGITYQREAIETSIARSGRSPVSGRAMCVADLVADRATRTRVTERRIDDAHLRCTLTGERMSDPVIASDGYAYDLDALMTRAREGTGLVSAVTGEPLDRVVRRHRNLREELALSRAERPTALLDDAVHVELPEGPHSVRPLPEPVSRQPKLRCEAQPVFQRDDAIALSVAVTSMTLERARARVGGEPAVRLVTPDV